MATRHRPAWRITPRGRPSPKRSCGTASARLATLSPRARIASRPRCSSACSSTRTCSRRRTGPRRSSCFPRRPTTPTSRSSPCRRAGARWHCAASSATRSPRARRCAGCRASTGWPATARARSRPALRRSSSSSRSPRAASWRWRSATARSSPCSRSATTTRCSGASEPSRCARTLGDREILVHAQTNVGVALSRSDLERGLELLEQAAGLAIEAELDEHAGRAILNAAWLLKEARMHARAREVLEPGLALMRERDIVIYVEYLVATRALIDLATGDWDAADAAAAGLVAQPRLANAVARIPALEVVGLVRLRRGHAEARAHLDEAWELARAADELQRLRPIACARAEAAWLQGDAPAVDAATRDTFALALEVGDEWDVGALALWRFRAGLPAAEPEACPPPIACELSGDARAAAPALGRARGAVRAGARPARRRRPRAAARRHRAARRARRGRRGRLRARPAAPRRRDRHAARAASRDAREPGRPDRPPARRCSSSWRRGIRTPRSRSGCSCRARPSSTTSRRRWPSSACARVATPRAPRVGSGSPQVRRARRPN